MAPLPVVTESGPFESESVLIWQTEALLRVLLTRVDLKLNHGTITMSH